MPAKLSQKDKHDVALIVQALEAERRRDEAARKRQKRFAGCMVDFEPGQSPPPSDEDEANLREALRSGPDPYAPDQAWHCVPGCRYPQPPCISRVEGA
jgi:hypothetical protein